MSGFVRLIPFVCLMANVTSGQSGSKISDQRTYYFRATDAVLRATEKVLRFLPTSDDGLLDKVINKKDRLERLIISCTSGFIGDKTCNCFDAYKDAFVLMNNLRSLKGVVANVTNDIFAPIDQVYYKWVSICPEYQTGQKVSLYYTPSEKYLSHARFPHTSCCKGEYSVGDWERNFFLREWGDANIRNIRYGDVAAVGYKEGRYLSNEGHYLNWYKTKLGSWEQFRVENGCDPDYERYGVVHMCDLVMFQAVDDGKYFQLGSRTSTIGKYHYAILDGQGSIPFWSAD